MTCRPISAMSYRTHELKVPWPRRPPVASPQVYTPWLRTTAAAWRAPTATAVTSNPSVPGTRGLHSFTSQLNLSAFYEIGVARRGCVARVKGVLWGVWGV